MSQHEELQKTPDKQNATHTQDQAQQAPQKETLEHLSQSEIEARALTRLADRLQHVIDDWNGKARTDLVSTLRDNRMVWGAFYDQVMAERSGEKPAHIPPHLSSNVIKLANFVFKRTIQAEGEPASDKISVLVTINREIAAGLLGASRAAR
ncbi:MAG: flagellar biosynthesis regulator FlaF [Pseudobdellovibrionaceae bacterium]